MTAPPALRHLPLRTRAFLLVVMAAAAGAVTATSLLTTHHESLDVKLLVITVTLCAAGALFEVLAPGNVSLQVSLVFFTWGSVMLPPWAIGALAVASFGASAVASSGRWYVAAFNAANYALAGLGAHAIFEVIAPHGTVDENAAVALFAAAGVVVLVNHVLIVGIVRLAHNRPWSAAIRESVDSGALDLALALTGGALAAMWTSEELLALLAVGPLMLMYRALYVPMLRHKSRLDPKTGLYNFEHLGVALERALHHAKRDDGHTGVLMIDLDHLRAVNNRWGHLAGDRLIRGVAEIIEGELEPGDVAARFGGEEFCVVLPGAATHRAQGVAEAIRRRVAESSWDFHDGDEALTATVSVGVAVYPEHGETAEKVLDAADAAVYDAKLGGRNRVRLGITADTERSVAEAAAAQAAINRHEQPLVEELPEAEIEVPVEQAAPADSPTRIHIGAVVLMLAGTGVIAALSSLDQIGAKPGIFAALVAAVLILDIVRLDVFDRGNVSPAGVPAIALAILFGPLGPILAEAVIGVSRAIRRTPARIWLADFGMLSLTGAATAWTWMALDPASHLAMLGGGAAAGLTSYVVNAALLIPLIALTRRVAMLDTFKEGFAWLWPHYLAFGLLAGGLVLAEESIGGYAFVLFAMPLVMLWLGEQQYINRSRSSVDELRAKHDELQSANASLRSLVDEKQALLSRMHRSYLSTITSLARTIEAKDPYTGGHTERVARIACLLAEEMAFGAEDVRAVNVGAVIHDIGKIGVPDRVLLKAGPLEPEEIDEIRRHPEISSYILADLDLPPIVKQMVRSHHERYGGGGYPDGLVGEEIPMAARILSVADALDAMTSDRPYRDAMPIEDALAEIDARIGEQFCPRVVAALHSCLDRQPELVSELFGVPAVS